MKKYPTYLKRKAELAYELERAAQARPYDPGAYNKIIDQLNSLKPPSFRHKRRRDWWMILLLWICFGIAVGIIVRLLFLT